MSCWYSLKQFYCLNIGDERQLWHSCFTCHMHACCIGQYEILKTLRVLGHSLCVDDSFQNDASFLYTVRYVYGDLFRFNASTLGKIIDTLMRYHLINIVCLGRVGTTLMIYLRSTCWLRCRNTSYVTETLIILPPVVPQRASQSGKLAGLSLIASRRSQSLQQSWAAIEMNLLKTPVTQQCIINKIFWKFFKPPLGHMSA